MLVVDKQSSCIRFTPSQNSESSPIQLRELGVQQVQDRTHTPLESIPLLDHEKELAHKYVAREVITRKRITTLRDADSAWFGEKFAHEKYPYDVPKLSGEIFEEKLSTHATEDLKSILPKTITIPENHQDRTKGNGFPMTISFSLKEGGFCSPEKIVITSTRCNGETHTVEAFAGKHVSDGTRSHIIVDFGNRQKMDWKLLPGAICTESSFQSGENILEGVTDLENDPHHDGRYNNFIAKHPIGGRIPSAIIHTNVMEWNSSRNASINAARSLLGLACNASMNPGMNLRFGAHLAATGAVGFYWVNGGDLLAKKFQQFLGVEQVSFTGTSSSDAQVEHAKEMGLAAGLPVYLILGSIKDNVGVKCKFIQNKLQMLSSVKVMAGLETFGCQFLPGVAMDLIISALGGDKINHPKLFIDSIFPTTLANGAGAALQSYLIYKGVSPAYAFLAFVGTRAFIFRPLAIATQAFTDCQFRDYVAQDNMMMGSNSTMFDGNSATPWNSTMPSTSGILDGNSTIPWDMPWNSTMPPPTNETLGGNSTTPWGVTWDGIIPPISKPPDDDTCSYSPSLDQWKSKGSANLINEAALLTLNGGSYVAGSIKKPDGFEEQLSSYCEDNKIPLHPLNQGRLTISKGADSLSAWLAHKFITRYPNNLISKFLCSPFGSAATCQSDRDFQFLRAEREHLSSEISDRTVVEIPDIESPQGTDPSRAKEVLDQTHEILGQVHQVLDQTHKFLNDMYQEEV